VKPVEFSGKKENRKEKYEFQTNSKYKDIRVM
jgi:hypothetical protein